jgi:hypothetical protein
LLNVVFVHLGSAPAEHLWLNLKRHSELFPDHPAQIILSEKTHAQEAENLGIPITYYQPSEYQDQLLESLSNGFAFRQGFWRYTLERLFALEIFHKQHPNQSILHIESDVLLMPNFPFSDFDSSDEMTWMNYNSEHDVSAILFSPRIEETTWLVRELEKLLVTDKSLTDMTALAKIRAMNSDRVNQLPGVIESKSGELSHCYDSAVLGMWLCGEDPRNHYGFLRLHNNSEYSRGSIDFNPSELNYSYSSTKGLQIKLASQPITVNCLHIHSKDLRLFGQNWESQLKYFVNLSKQPKPMKKFLASVLVQLFKDNAAQNSLIRFMFGIPPIYKFRMWARQKLKM